MEIIGIIFGALISLLIFYFLIKGAIKEAIIERMEPFLKMQTAYLRHLAKQAGMSDEEIDKTWMSDKQFRKKYQHDKR